MLISEGFLKKMPIYLYVCNSCGHELEVLQKVSDDPLTHCPSCGKPALHKQITAAAFRLKGTGWYETDFKHSDKEANDKQAPKAKVDESAGSNSEKSSDTKKAEKKKVSKGTEDG